MVDKKPENHYFYFNSDERNFLDKKFNTIDRTSRIKKIKNFLLREESVDEISIDDKIKRQQLLKLQLQNWKELKSNGLIMEEAKAILLEKQEMKEPTLEDNSDLKHDGGLNGYSFCSFCHHEHAGTEPRVCKKVDCNCGVRG